jgi:hypothetical protein
MTTQSMYDIKYLWLIPRPIVDWQRRNGSVGLSLREADASTSRWIDMDLRVDYPYVYAHYGQCHHVLLIKEIRCGAQWM